MKRKQTLLFAIITVIAVLFSSCTINVDYSDDSVAINYEAYINVLSQIHPDENSDKDYTVFDINSDSVYELIVSHEIWEYDVYTMKNNEVIFIGTFSTKYGLYSYDNTALLSSTGGTGYSAHHEVYIDDNFSIVEKETPFLEIESIEPISYETQYRCNGVNISKEEYDEYSNKLNRLTMHPLNDYTLIEFIS